MALRAVDLAAGLAARPAFVAEALKRRADRDVLRVHDDLPNPPDEPLVEHAEDVAEQRAPQGLIPDREDHLGGALDDGLRLLAVAVVHRPRGEECEPRASRVEQPTSATFPGELQDDGLHAERRPARAEHRPDARSPNGRRDRR